MAGAAEVVVALAGTVERAKRLLEVRDRRAIDRAMANARQADYPFGTIPPRGITRDRLKCGVTYRQLEKEVRLWWYANTERSSCAEMMCDVEVDGVPTKVSQGIFWMARSALHFAIRTFILALTRPLSMPPCPVFTPDDDARQLL